MFVAGRDFTRKTEFFNLCQILVDDFGASDPHNFGELVEGVGDNVEDLAALVITHLGLLLTHHPDKTFIQDRPVFLSAPLQLLHDTQNNRSATPYSLEGSPRFLLDSYACSPPSLSRGICWETASCS